LFLDENSNGVNDPGEQLAGDITADSNGSFSKSITIPFIAAGNYEILADFPGYPTSTSFEILEPPITFSPDNIPPGTSVTLSGTHFVPNTSGSIYLDVNKKDILDEGELLADQVSTDSGGQFSSTFVIPSVPTGLHPIRVDIPSGDYVESSATIRTLGILSVSPSIAPAGFTVRLTGSNFNPGHAGPIYFDEDKDDVASYPNDISLGNTVVDNDGNFGTSFLVPAIRDGDYQILVQLPISRDPNGFVPFSIGPGLKFYTKSINPSNEFDQFASSIISDFYATKFIPGNNVYVNGFSLAPDSSGSLYLDENNNGEVDNFDGWID